MSGTTDLVAVVLVLVVMGACARDRDDAVERRLGALSSPETVGFQDGTNGYAGAADTQIVQNAPATNYGTATSLSADGDDPPGSGRDTAILLRWDLSSIPRREHGAVGEHHACASPTPAQTATRCSPSAEAGPNRARPGSWPRRARAGRPRARWAPATAT